MTVRLAPAARFKSRPYAGAAVLGVFLSALGLAAGAQEVDQDLSSARDRIALLGVHIQREHSPLGAAPCVPDSGDECVGGVFWCGVRKAQCLPPEEVVALVGVASALGLAFPDDHFILGQAVYLSREAGLVDEARRLAAACTGEEWFCSILRGVSAYRGAEYPTAVLEYSRAVRTMPEEEFCAWTDLQYLIPHRGDYVRVDCESRAPWNDLIWWLSDPSWTDSTNYRRLAHWDRMAMAMLHDNYLEGASVVGAVVDWVAHPEGHHRQLIGFGVEDTWDFRPGRRTSRLAARYQFLPSWSAIENPWEAPVSAWDLDAPFPSERYSDPTWSTVIPLPIQFGRFEAGEDAVFLGVIGIPVGSAFRPGVDRVTTMVIASSREESWSTFGGGVETKVALVDTISEGEYVVGLEVSVIDEGVLARARFGAGPPRGRDLDLRVSDIVFFEDGDETAIPESLEELKSLALARDFILPGQAIGAYWEVYGAAVDRPVEIAVQVHRKAGLFGSIARLFSGGGTVTTQWEEFLESDGDGVLRRGLAFESRSWERGSYEIEITIRQEGRAPVVRTRVIDVG